MTRAYCTRYHLHDLQECERLPKKYFVAFVLFIYILQHKLPFISLLGFPFVRFYKVYVHIPYGAFVALDIFGGAFMGFFQKLRLYIECFNLAGIDGLKACHKYLSGVLSLPDLPSESLVFSVGGLDA